MIVLIRLFFLFTMVVGCVAVGRAQIDVDNTTTPQEALELLLGNGVEVFNVQFSGNPDQIGSFIGVNSNVGMVGGVILGSGNVNLAETGADGIGSGGNDEGSGTLGGGNFGAGDPDLTLVSGFATHDAVILEFDFIALGESIQFDYVFASEEYNEFVCGSVNDAFGFFLSGPGINGPFSQNAINLARVPGTDIPVTINTVNNGTVGTSGFEQNCIDVSPDWNQNAAYFIDNTVGVTPQSIQFDGLTVVLTAQADVICNGTYHIKIALADGGDTAWDSAVFLEQGSFDSPGIIISANLTNTIDDNTIHENCGGAEITFERVGNTAEAFDLTINYYGTADAQLDFESLPTSITFPAGENTVSFFANPIVDGVLEGLEELIIEVIASGCNGEASTFSLFLSDEELDVSASGPQPDCPSEVITIESTVLGGVEPYTYAWSTGSTEADHVGGFAATETVTLTVTDACGIEESATHTVVVPIPEPIEVMLELELLNCAGFQALQPLVEGGYPPYTFEWVLDGTTVGDMQNVDVWVSENTVIDFVITDACNLVTVEPIDLLLVEHPPLEINAPIDPEMCFGTLIPLTVSLEGGYGPHSILWEHDGSTSWSNTVGPGADRTYIYTITDGCGETFEEEITVFVYRVAADFSFDYIGISEVAFTNLSFNNDSNFWSFGDGATSFEIDPTHLYNDLSFTTYVTLTVTSEQGCVAQSRQVLPPFMTAYVPNVFTPDNDGLNEIFTFSLIGVKVFTFRVFNRWGEEVFFTDRDNEFWNGSVNGGAHYSPDGVYVWVLEMEGFEANVKRLTGSVIVVR